MGIKIDMDLTDFTDKDVQLMEMDMDKNLKNMEKFKTLAEKLKNNSILEENEYEEIIEASSDERVRALFAGLAVEVREAHYGRDVYTRGLIEFTNICKNNCLYCGIRAGNNTVERYRLTEEEILSCAAEGYELGFRTFVLQGGEDDFFTPEAIGSLITKIKKMHPDCAVTLSVGEHEKEIYKYWYDCGADRYLLRHETATREHYEALHPKTLSFEHRIQCLYDLKDIGYQVGAGFMVGSPGQTVKHLAHELIFLKKFDPQMVGIGPFIPAEHTPFENEKQGTLEQTLLMLSLIRLTLPRVLLPATTALGTIHPRGRELGIQAGANVVMPNLSPVAVRKKYQLYDNKICTGEESAQCRGCLENRMESVGYKIVTARGDYKGIIPHTDNKTA